MNNIAKSAKTWHKGEMTLKKSLTVEGSAAWRAVDHRPIVGVGSAKYFYREPRGADPYSGQFFDYDSTPIKQSRLHMRNPSGVFGHIDPYANKENNGFQKELN